MVLTPGRLPDMFGEDGRLPHVMIILIWENDGKMMIFTVFTHRILRFSSKICEKLAGLGNREICHKVSLENWRDIS